MKPLRVLALTRYGELGASSRLRFIQYFPALQVAGIQVKLLPLFDDVALTAKYQLGQYGAIMTLDAYAQRIKAMFDRHAFDLLWIEKEALPWCPLWLESFLMRGLPFVLDYDDAVFHNYDLHRLGIVRQLYGTRLDRLMANAKLVVCGNAYLAQRAINSGASWVEQLPTVIDLNRYPIKPAQVPIGDSDLPRVVWIGSPSTVKYLELLGQSLQALSIRKPFVLRVIGAHFVLPTVQIECMQWSENTEVAAISGCAVGVMPLLDSAWERGKCGYKLIQYMGCSMPVVASDVGVNAEIVHCGVNGFLANSADEWVDAMLKILNDAYLRHHMGKAGRQRVEEIYCIQKTGPVMAKWLKRAAVNH